MFSQIFLSIKRIFNMALFFGKDLVIWAFECYEEDDWLQFDFNEQIWQDLIKEIKKT